LNDILKNIYQKNISIISLSDKIIHFFRTQNFDAALRTSTITINEISDLLKPLFSSKSYINENSEFVDDQSIMNMLRSLLDAQEKNDFILLADLYEIQLIPYLIHLQEIIMAKEEFVFDEERYQSNLITLKESQPQLGAYLSSLPSPLTLFDQGYSIEYTSCGLMTLALDDNGRKYYMHTNNRIQNEAFTLANSWYSYEKTEYIIYGLGLGYHVGALSEIDNNINIEVYESDINIIQLAFAFSDLIYIVQKPNIKIIYDPDYTELMKSINNITEISEFILHYPSLRNIKNIDIKENLENYFIQYSSIKNQLSLLNGNFNANILNNDGVIDELKNDFEDKDLYIIAAGPSLDKNFMQLKELGENTIILATGTVFRKLLNAGITPDYVIVTDPNPRVYRQIAGLEDCDVPMLFLATAFKGYTKNYKGKRYMILQEDFNKAEKYAEQKGFSVYKTGGSVSTTALELGIRLCCKRIIFLGLDLAFTDNFVHAQGTSRRELASSEGLRKVKDIHGNMVYTSRNLDIYRKWIENRIIDKEVIGIDFINATEGGALISGMRILQLEKVIHQK
jgi:hypothetical protein